MLAAHNNEKFEIHFEIDIEAPIHIVWEKISSFESMREWFSSNLIFEHKVGGRFQMEGEMPEEGTYKFSGEVVRIEPHKELAFTWRPEHSDEGNWAGNTSLVSFRLSPTASGTKVSLSHTGFDAQGPEQGKLAYESHIQGWTRSGTLDSLKSSVASK
jgi:uncharacterized protein YndB with AHSA1/START domain